MELAKWACTIDIKSQYSSKEGYAECLVGFQRYCLFWAAPKGPNYQRGFLLLPADEIGQWNQGKAEKLLELGWEVMPYPPYQNIFYLILLVSLNKIMITSMKEISNNPYFFRAQMYKLFFLLFFFFWRNFLWKKGTLPLRWVRYPGPFDCRSNALSSELRRFHNFSHKILLTRIRLRMYHELFKKVG